MKAYRAAVLRFSDEGRALYDEDGLLVVGDDGHFVAVGDYATLKARFSGADVEHLAGRILAPGFIDLHIHYPQTDVIGSPAEGLLPWLERYTFPEESRFADAGHASAAAKFFLDELARNGVTTALVFGSSHPQSVDAFFAEARARCLRMVCGKALMDRHVPDGVRDEAEQGLIDTEALIGRWHGVDRLGCAITPRFAPSCSEAQLRGAGELARRHPDVWIQSHVAENEDEVRWAGELFPAARSYLGVYGDFGLLRERAVYAHCIHLDFDDRALLRSSGAAAAVCPTSNLFLGSGFFDYAKADEAGFRYGLASDVGGGTSFCPFHTMLAAYYVGREGRSKTGTSLTPEQLWWQHTGGAARALRLDGSSVGGNRAPAIGNLAVGHEADFLVLNPKATPLLARKTGQASCLAELLFALIVLGDDRVVERTHIARLTPRIAHPA